MDTISVQGEVGKEEIRYFYSFIRSPVIAPGFLKLSQTSPQCYEDLVSHLNKKLMDPVLKGLQMRGGKSRHLPGGRWPGGDPCPWVLFSPSGVCHYYTCHVINTPKNLNIAVTISTRCCLITLTAPLRLAKADFL